MECALVHVSFPVMSWGTTKNVHLNHLVDKLYGLLCVILLLSDAFLYHHVFVFFFHIGSLTV